MINDSKAHDRIPLIVSTKVSGLNINSLVHKVERKGVEFVNFDLRKASNLKHSAKMAVKTMHQSSTAKEFDRYMSSTKETLAQAVVEGKLF